MTARRTPARRASGDAECRCGRGAYDPARRDSCFECFLDRRASQLECVFCWRWHSPRFATCHACRSMPGAEDAAANTRRTVLGRDRFACRWCGSDGGGDVSVAHVVPAKSGGSHHPWNLATWCAACLRAKGVTWFPGCPHEAVRETLLKAYAAELRPFLSAAEQVALRSEVAEWRRARGFPALRPVRHRALPYDLGTGGVRPVVDVCECGWSGEERAAGEVPQRCPSAAAAVAA